MTDVAESRQLAEFRQQAEDAAQAVERAMEVAGLPPLVSLGPAFMASGTPLGGHVSLGGCNVLTALALADYLTAHARCTGRLLSGSVRRPSLDRLVSLGLAPQDTRPVRGRSSTRGELTA